MLSFSNVILYGDSVWVYLKTCYNFIEQNFSTFQCKDYENVEFTYCWTEGRYKHIVLVMNMGLKQDANIHIVIGYEHGNN